MSLPITMVNDFYLEVTRGNVTGFAAKELIGINAAVGGTEDIWNYGGNITQPAAAAVVHVSSSSASDVTQYVKVTGLDANYDEITETIGMLQGQTELASGVKQFLRVNNAELVATAPIVLATTAATLRVSSTSGGDTTQVVTVTGLDADGNEIIEQFELTGQTIVVGTKLFLRVTSAVASAALAGKVYVYYLTTASSGVPVDETKIQAAIVSDALLVAVGDVYVYYDDTVVAGVPQTATKVRAKIAAGDLHPHSAIYTVPRNKNWYMTSLRYRSAGATTAYNVIISAIRKVYGGSNETVKTVKYPDLATTKFTDNQVQFTDKPVLFPAKSEIRFTAGLAGGTALNITVEAEFIEESITAVPNTVTVYTKAAYLASYAAPIASQNYWLIGLDEEPGPNVLPASANLDDVLTTITGATNYTVAADTDVIFDRAYYTGSGKLVTTTKKAVLTLMRCVDNSAVVWYVLAPTNTIYSIKNVKKISYLHN
jgi:hypothetical protein